MIIRKGSGLHLSGSLVIPDSGHTEKMEAISSREKSGDTDTNRVGSNCVRHGSACEGNVHGFAIERDKNAN